MDETVGSFPFKVVVSVSIKVFNVSSSVVVVSFVWVLVEAAVDSSDSTGTKMYMIQ